jgi:secreted PhoX family phosphatase
LVYKTLSEFAGLTFAPNGKTFFVNIQGPGMTFAIWGPFQQSSGARQRQTAVAAPPAHLAPFVSGELAEAAERYGMSKLEAAAFASLGVPLA